MWKKQDISSRALRFERVIGVSIPQEKIFLIITYDKLLVINLFTLNVKIYEDIKEGGDEYDRESQIFVFRGSRYDILGLFGGKAIMVNRLGDKLFLDEDLLRIETFSGIQEIEYDNLSGDWECATFSREGDIILLATPYSIEVLTNSPE